MHQKILFKRQDNDQFTKDVDSAKNGKPLSKALYTIPCVMLWRYTWADDLPELKGAALEGLAQSIDLFDECHGDSFLAYSRKIIGSYLADSQRESRRWANRHSLGLSTKDADILVQDDDDPEKLILRKEIYEKVYEIMYRRLTYDQLGLITLVFGLDEGNPINLNVASHVIGMPYASARRQYFLALEIIRAELNDFV